MTTTFRSAIPDFQLANPLYVAATVTFTTVNASGASTGVLAALYTDPTGSSRAANPQTLDGDGKFVAPVYIDAPVIAEIVGLHVATHRTGPINARGTWRGLWVTATNYYSTDLVQDFATNDVYVVVDHYTSGASIAADVTAGHLQLVLDLVALTKLSLTHPAYALGTSETQGVPGTSATAPAPLSWPSQLAALLSGSVTNLGVGGHTAAQVIADYTALSSGVKAAGTFFFEFGPNDHGVNPYTFQSVCRAAAQTLAAAVPHNRFCFFPSIPLPNPGSAYGSRCVMFRRWLDDNYRENFIDLIPIFQAAGNGFGDDLNDVRLGDIPRSLRHDYVTDPLHINAAGCTPWAHAALDWLTGLEGRAPFMPPLQEKYFERSASLAAQQPGAAVYHVRAKGVPTGWAIIDGNQAGLFSIDGSGLISRTSLPYDGQPYYSLSVQASAGGQGSVGVVRLLYGAVDTQSYDVQIIPGEPVPYNDGFGSIDSGGPRILTPEPMAVDGPSLTIVAAIWFQEDDTEQAILSIASQAVYISRTTDHRIRIQVFNAARDANIADYHLGNVGDFTAAAGLKWIFIKIDGTAGAVVGRVNEANLLTTAVALPAATTLELAAGISINGSSYQENVFWAGDGLGAVRFNGIRRLLWIGAGLIDVADSAKRALFYDSSDNSAVDLGDTGVVSTVTPFFLDRGNAADFLRGRNDGNGGECAAFIITGSIGPYPPLPSSMGTSTSSADVSTLNGANWFDDYDCRGAYAIRFTDIEDVAAFTAGSFRDTLFAENIVTVTTNYTPHQHVNYSVRGVTRGPYSAGLHTAVYQDLIGLDGTAIGRIEDPNRGCSGITATAIQFGQGIASNEFAVVNPVGAATQSLSMCPGQFELYAKKGDADLITPHTVTGVEVVNLGKLATSGFTLRSAGTDGDPGTFMWGINLLLGTVTLAGIKMPYSTDVGTIIEYSGTGGGAWTDYKSASKTYRWNIDGNTVATSDSIVNAPFRNRLINPRFEFARRVAGAVSDDTYGICDRWNILTQTGSITPTQQTLTANGIPFNLRLNQDQASAQRFGVEQIIESSFCRDLRAQPVVLSGKVRISNSQAVRYAILEWTGTVNSVTSDVVNDWTDSSYTPNHFFLAANINVLAVGALTPSAATWTALPDITATVGSSANNLIVLVWTEGTAAQNVTLDLTNMQIEQGSVSTTFAPRAMALEVSMCQRYFTKCFNEATSPVQNLGGNQGAALFACQANGSYAAEVVLPVTMRAAPTVTTYNPFGTNANWRDIVNSADRTVGTSAYAAHTQKRLYFTIASAVAGSENYIHWSADAEL